MTLYTYKAFDPTGAQISGEIEADSQEAALDNLVRKDYIPEWVKEKSGKTNSAFFSSMALGSARVKPGDLVLYTKQFKTLLQAGIDILQIFKVMEAQTENRGLKTVTAGMVEMIQKGSTLHQAFSVHKKVFSKLYCAMIRTGEESGALPKVLERLIYIIEHEEKVKNEIKAAVRYPLIVLAFLGIAFIILLTFVVPKFAAVFGKAGIELPLPTRMCMFMYDIVHHYWLFMIIGTVLTVIGLFQYVKTDRGRLVKDKLLLAIPIIGPVIIKSAMSRFSSIFAILQSSGITVLDAMGILAEAINNAAITRELVQVRTQLEEGQGIAKPLSQARYFTPMVINMVAIGEESGNLDAMLEEIASHYDAEVEYATKGLSDAIGPVLMVGLAAVVGFFAFAIFLPMWDLTKMVN